MTIGKGERPRDLNHFAKWIVDRCTSETEELILTHHQAFWAIDRNADFAIIPPASGALSFEGHQPDTGDTVVRVARLRCVQECKVSTASRLMFWAAFLFGH